MVRNIKNWRKVTHQSAICDLQKMKMKLEIDVLDKNVRVWLKELSHSLEPELEIFTLSSYKK